MISPTLSRNIVKQRRNEVIMRHWLFIEFMLVITGDSPSVRREGEKVRFSSVYIYESSHHYEYLVHHDRDHPERQ
jgi:hypothetical protein